MTHAGVFFQISCWLGNIKSKTRVGFFLFLWKKQHVLFLMNKEFVKETSTFPNELADNVQVSNMPRVTALNIKSQTGKVKGHIFFFSRKRSKGHLRLGLDCDENVIYARLRFFLNPELCLWDPIKTGSYDTIHTFKNYFPTVFSVSNF